MQTMLPGGQQQQQQPLSRHNGISNAKPTSFIIIFVNASSGRFFVLQAKTVYKPPPIRRVCLSASKNRSYNHVQRKSAFANTLFHSRKPSIGIGQHWLFNLGATPQRLRPPPAATTKIGFSLMRS